MRSRKELKKNARGALKRNYWGIVITCALIAIVMGYFTNPVTSIENAVKFRNGGYVHKADADIVMADNARRETLSNTDIVDKFLGGMGMENEDAKKWTAGVLSVFARNTEGAGNVMYGIINAINQIAFGDRLSPRIIISMGVLLSLIILIFLKNILKVGYCRYLLEVRAYSRTRLNRVLFPWHIKRGRKVVKTTFLKSLYQFLWNFTIIGGIIKRYSYRLVPYIAAENPDITAKDAIALSRRMMDGNKWRTFVLDLSFLPWRVLNVLTLNFLNVLFIAPYANLTDAELYMSLREKAKTDKISNSDKLCDELLSADVTNGEYPVNEYMIPPYPSRHWAHADYDRNYSITSLILIFFTFSFIGWLWEVGLHLFTTGVFVNRGVSYGPWLPIYGTGGVLVLIVLKKLRNKPALTFLATMVLCGIVEYFTSWYLEWSRGMRWWDYSGYFLNLNGRICLEGLIVFALGGSAAIYLIAPSLDNLFCKIPKKIKITICVALVTLFLCDQTYSHFVPNSGKGITDY